MGLDRNLYLDVNSLSRDTGWAHGFMSDYALWGGLVVVAALALAAGLWARRRGSLSGVAIMVLAGVSALVSLGINHFLSLAVARPRPCHALHHVVVILSCAHDYSFPSDHSVIAGALATGMLFFSRRLGIVAILLAVTVAFARVYAGVHYPGDVLGGLVLGALVAAAVARVLRRPAIAAATRLAATPLRPLISASGRPASRSSVV
jgi:membrane-associated phospholipid phosphatase